MRKLVYILIVLAAAAYILLRPVNEAVVRDDQVKLSAAVTPVATPTPVPTPSPTPTPVPTPTPTPTPTPFMISVNSLYEGLSDTKGSNEIARLQNCLEEKGYYKGAVDGTYGAATADAVRYFQSVNGLPVTGVADAVTIYAVYSDECIVDPAPSPTPFVNGVKGEEVIALQERLRLFGFLGSDADGAFGAKTETAVLMAQEYLHALEQQKASAEVTPVPTPTAVWMTPTPTPVVTPQNVLDESIGAYVDLPTPSPTPTIRFTPTPAPWTADGTVTEEFVEKLNDDNFVYYVSDVKNGDKTDEAKRIQNRLVVLGYMKKSDGVFGSGTERALMYFQYRNGLPETGIADLQTQSRLYSVDAKTSDTIVTQYKITVSTSKQRTYVYKWNGRSFDTTPVKTFKCSTGLNATPTPKGEFWVTGPTGSRWHYFKDFDCYAQWAWVIEGGQGILFHSVIYSTPNENSLRRGTVSQLGSKASHGCVRLSVADAKWIYDNCASGTPVTVE